MLALCVQASSFALGVAESTKAPPWRRDRANAWRIQPQVVVKNGAELKLPTIMLHQHLSPLFKN